MSMRQHKVNAGNNFIAGWYLDDDSLCEELLTFFKNTPGKESGLVTGYQGKGNMDPNAKDSLDLNLPPGDLARRYIGKLNEVAREYLRKYEIDLCNRKV